MSLAVASTFSGVGGIDLGFRSAGIPTRLLCEYDKHAASVLARRFPGVPIHPDVTELTADDLANAGLVPERTILAGGFPCQDLSVAGARRGMGEGTRSGLYWHLDRLMAEFRPAWVVFENVPGLLSSNGGRDMGAVLGSLADRGYGFAYRVLDAQFFGVPQRRRRVIIVGRLGDSGAAPAQVLLEPEGGGWNPPASREAGPRAASHTALRAVEAGGEVTPTLTARYGKGADSTVSVPLAIVSTLQASGGDRGYRVDAEAAAGGHLIPVTVMGDHTHALTAEGHDASEDGTGRGTPVVAFHLTQDPISGDVSPAMGAKSTGMGIHTETTVRRLTPLECERLQGHPDNWTEGQSDSQRYKQMGNGVAVPVFAWVAERLAHIDKEAAA